MRYFLFIAIFAASISCKSQKKAAAEEAKANEAAADTLVMMVEQKTEPRDSLVISFEKTPCFGHCPVYNVKIYESGFAIYEGRNFVEKMGMYATRFDSAEIEKIYNKALDIGYFDLKNEYNDPLITDLPSTISRIHFGGQDHKIRARFNTPKRLVEFHDNLAVTLLEKNWKPYDNR